MFTIFIAEIVMLPTYGDDTFNREWFSTREAAREWLAHAMARCEKTANESNIEGDPYGAFVPVPDLTDAHECVGGDGYTYQACIREDYIFDTADEAIRVRKEQMEARRAIVFGHDLP